MFCYETMDTTAAAAAAATTEHPSSVEKSFIIWLSSLFISTPGGSTFCLFLSVCGTVFVSQSSSIRMQGKSGRPLRRRTSKTVQQPCYRQETARSRVNFHQRHRRTDGRTTYHDITVLRGYTNQLPTHWYHRRPQGIPFPIIGVIKQLN